MKPFDIAGECARNKTSRTGASTPRPALDNETCTRGLHMPVEGNITARGDSASGQSRFTDYPNGGA